MGSYGEEIRWGAEMARQREAEIVAQKRIICEFFNSINYNSVVELKRIKERYPNYDQFRVNIEMINNHINDTTKNLKWSFIQTTKDALNQNLTNLRAQLADANISKLFVDNIYNDYREYGGKLSIYEFLSEFSNCEVIVNTTAQYVSTDDVALAEATLIRNKYLKYKQKYLTLKNKIN
jgi:hypothetical protein